jgi:hypothetical protein
VPYTRRERSDQAGRPGRSVVASASALGAEDRRFESCRPDSMSATKTRQGRNSSWKCGCSSMAELQPSKLVMRVRFSSPAPREGPSQGPLRSAAVLLRDSSPRSGHYAGHWVAAPPTGPLSPSFLVCVDALGGDGFAQAAGWCEASTADLPAWGQRTARTGRRTPDHPTRRPPEPARSTAAAALSAKIAPAASASAIRSSGPKGPGRCALLDA